MQNYLANLQKFKVDSVRSVELILPNDQRVHSDRSMEIFMERPDHLRINVKSATRDAQIFYDGKTLTVYTPKRNFYATVAAKPTIGETLDYVRTRHDIDFPVLDLLQKNRQDLLMKNVQSGEYVGKDMIDGVMHHHLAFRQNDIDWQIWVQEGDTPLPKRIIINDKTQKGEPQSITTFSNWDLSPTFQANLFTFSPPEGARQIAIVATPTTEAVESQRVRQAKD